MAEETKAEGAQDGADGAQEDTKGRNRGADKRTGQGFRDLTARWTAERVERLVELLHANDRLALAAWLEAEVPRVPYRDDPPDMLDLKGLHFDALDYQVDLGRVRMEKLNLWKAKFGKINLKEASFEDCRLSLATFEGSYLYRAKFLHCDLQSAQFIGAFLMRTAFIDTHLRFSSFENCRINIADLPNQLLEEQQGDFQLASDIYKSLRLNLQALGDVRGASEAALKQQQLQRREHWRQSRNPKKKRPERLRHLRQAAWRYAMEWLWGYGERPQRMLGFSFLFCLTWGLLYYAVGFGSGGVCLEPGARTPIEQLELSMYMSFVTFTTVGYGDFSPCTMLGRLLATFQAFCGVFVMGLYVSANARTFSGD